VGILDRLNGVVDGRRRDAWEGDDRDLSTSQPISEQSWSERAAPGPVKDVGVSARRDLVAKLLVGGLQGTRVVAALRLLQGARAERDPDGQRDQRGEDGQQVAPQRAHLVRSRAQLAASSNQALT